jgi:hypothetical protein
MALNSVGLYNCLAQAKIVEVFPVPGGPLEFHRIYKETFEYRNFDDTNHKKANAAVDPVL